MAEPSLDPAELIANEGTALAEKLAAVARDVIKGALIRGNLATADDIINALQGVVDTLPPALAAAIADELPRIAEQATLAAEVSIAPAREESGRGYPTVPTPQFGNFLPWAATATTALLSSIRRRIEPAGVVEPSTNAADAAELSSEILSELDTDIRKALDALAETAAGRAINDAREATFVANVDVVPRLKYTAVRDNKTSEMCQHLAGVEFNTLAQDIPRPPLHPGCRSHLVAVMRVKQRPGMTEKEKDRQAWAVFRRLERQAKAEAEGRADERLEFRFAPSLDAAGTFTGYAVTWNELDGHRTSFAPGSFTAPASGLPLLWAHDPARPVGTILEAREDERGLLITGRLSLSTADGAEAHAFLKDRAVTGLSIGFKRLADEPTAGGRRITQAALKEISLVTIPSNSSARIIEVRAAPAARAASNKEGQMPLDNAAPAEGDINNRVEKLESTVSSIATKVDEIASAVSKTEQRADRIEARSARLPLGGGDQPANNALETRAFGRFLRSGRESMAADEIRSLRVADDVAGGFTATSEFRAELLRKLVETSPIRTAAAVTTTSAGELVLPKQTGTPTASWVGETETRTGSEPAFGQVTIPAHEAATFIDVSVKLLEDSAVNIESELSSMLAEEYGRLEGLAFISGNGVKKPRGILSHPDFSTMANGSTSALDADKIIALVYSLPATYRRNGVFLANASTIAAVRSLKSSVSGEYLFKESLADGVAGTLLGYKIVETPDLDNVASGKVPLIFGDLKASYRVVDRVGLSLLRDPFSAAISGLVRFHSRMRVGGDLIRPEALKGLKMSNS